MMTAAEFFEARERQLPIATLPSSAGWDMDAAYTQEMDLRKRREAAGHTVVGRKVGYANKAMWRILKLETLVWDAMYEDTVHLAPQGRFEFAIAPYRSPKIEPEIVIKVRDTQVEGLAGAEWVAFGFEILDNPYPDWKFQPVDFVAAWGLHAGLIVGPLMEVTPANVETLTAQLAAFKLSLLRGDEVVEQGAGKNSLRSPVACVTETIRAGAARRDFLSPGEIVSTGTLTTAPEIKAGETWRAEFDGIDLPTLRVQFT